MVSRNFVLVIRLLSLSVVSLSWANVRFYHQRKRQKLRTSSCSLFTGLVVGFSTKLSCFQVSFCFLLLEFTLSLSQDRCETAALEMSLASVKVRLEMFRKQACEDSLVRLFPKRCHAPVCKASSSCCLSCWSVTLPPHLHYMKSDSDQTSGDATVNAVVNITNCVTTDVAKQQCLHLSHAT